MLNSLNSKGGNWNLNPDGIVLRYVLKYPGLEEVKLRSQIKMTQKWVATFIGVSVTIENCDSVTMKNLRILKDIYPELMFHIHMNFRKNLEK